MSMVEFIILVLLILGAIWVLDDIADDVRKMRKNTDILVSASQIDAETESEE